MRSFWSDPFLWVHFSGLAVVPIFLELCWLGLAVGDPVLPVWLEFFLVAAIGIAPVLWMQLFRPFYIFSFLFVSLKPEQLTTEQRRILSLFKTQVNQVLAAITSVFLLWVLWQIYCLAPVVADVTPLPPGGRLAGLLLAGLAFMASNLFVQIPVSVARSLLISEAQFSATEPYPLEKISGDFTIPGWWVNQILPPMATTPTATTTASEPEKT